MHQDIETVLFDERQIRDRVRELGRKITADLAGQEVVILALLKGSVIFFADLLRSLDLPVRVDFAWTSSYGAGMRSSGTVQLRVFPDDDLTGRSVLLVDDILDTGRTLQAVDDRLRQDRGASMVRKCVLLEKSKPRDVPICADYVGFRVDDVFVVGYGLDYADRYRNLPYIGVLKPGCGERHPGNDRS